MKTVEDRFQSWRHVLTAYAESASGPGWSNSLIWLIGRDKDGNLVQEALQPGERTDRMEELFAVSQAAHLSMTRLAKDYLPRGARDDLR